MPLNFEILWFIWLWQKSLTNSVSESKRGGDGGWSWRDIRIKEGYNSIWLLLYIKKHCYQLIISTNDNILLSNHAVLDRSSRPKFWNYLKFCYYGKTSMCSIKCSNAKHLHFLSDNNKVEKRDKNQGWEWECQIWGIFYIWATFHVWEWISRL